MGWTQSTDMNGQVRLAFDTREEAVAYAAAARHRLPGDGPQARQAVIKAYADNFAFARKVPWTH